LLKKYPNSKCRILMPPSSRNSGKEARKLGLKTQTLVWYGMLQPTEISRKYKIRVELPLKGSPKAYMEEPKMEMRGGNKPPHIYNYEEGKMCLYLPNSKEWTTFKRLADTLIPWISEWLFFYEIWLLTGEWEGGGKHPGIKKEES